jgi:hypothetical protein
MGIELIHKSLVRNNKFTLCYTEKDKNPEARLSQYLPDFRFLASQCKVE